METLERRPFRPFVIELDNGRRVRVEHPEEVLFVPSRTDLWHVTIHDRRKDQLVSFEPSAVTALVNAR